MFETSAAMVEPMPSGSMRKVDKRPKFPAYLLTYSQTKLSVDYAFRELLKLQFPRTEVVVERHMDGGLHIHALLIGNKVERRRLSPEKAIIGGERPNIRGKGSKDIWAARWYIRKSYIDARGLEDLEDDRSCFQRLLHQKSYEDAVRLWPGLDSKGYVYNRINGEIGLKMHYEKKLPFKYVPKYDMNSFIVPVEVQNWIDKYVHGEYERPKSLILWGPTRMGKTKLARSIGEHWYMNTDWDVTQINEDVQYGVIDDIASEKFMYWKAFLGGQEQFTVTDKFHRKKQLSWEKPVIWISNKDPKDWKGIDYEWLIGNKDDSKSNVVKVEIKFPLF